MAIKQKEGDGSIEFRKPLNNEKTMDIVFFIGDKEVLRLTERGFIYNNKAGTDLGTCYRGFKEFLQKSKILTTEQ